MCNYIKSDFYKLIRTKSIYVIALLVVAVSVGILVTMRQIATGDATPDMGVNMSLISDTILSGILGGIILGDIVIDDFTTKFVHNKIISGKGRVSIIFSKLISFSIAYALILLIYAIVAMIAVGSGKEFAPLAGIPSAFFDLIAGCTTQTEPEMVKMLGLCIVIIVGYISRLSICLPFAFKSKKKILVLVVGFMTSFVFDIVLSLVEDVKIVSDFIKLLPYYRMTQLSIDVSCEEIIYSLLSSVGFIAIMTLITYFVFKQDEIK